MPGRHRCVLDARAQRMVAWLPLQAKARDRAQRSRVSGVLRSGVATGLLPRPNQHEFIRLTALARPVRAASTPDRESLEQRCAGTAYRPAVMDETHALATDPLALARGKSLVFYPDHVVFLGVGVATGLDDNPPLVALAGVGVLIRDDAKPAIEPMGRCLADVMRRVAESDRLTAQIGRAHV